MSQDQLRRAHVLIEQGRTADARQILETIDDPEAQAVARLWLTQMSAARRPNKRGLILPLPLLVGLGLVIGVIVLILMLLLTPTLLNRMQNRAEDTAAQVVEDEALSAALVHYCTMATGSGGEEPCLSWMEQVIAQYRPAAVTCVEPFGVDTPEARSHVGDCLAANGVPAPI